MPPATSIDVELKTDGQIPREEAQTAREVIAHLGRYTRHPITGARLTLRRSGMRRSPRPVIADVFALVDGRPLAAHTTGTTARQAAEEARDRLRTQLRRIAGADVALRNEPRVIERALAAGEPLKPPQEREIIHRHTYLDIPLSSIEAVAELLDLDLEFFLFRHVRTEGDLVVYRCDDGRIGLLFPKGGEPGDEDDIVVPRQSRYDGPLSLSAARREMDWLNHRFLYFIDEADDRGKVIYLRHDGDYGLVQPRDHG